MPCGSERAEGFKWTGNPNRAVMDWVKRLSIGKSVAEPLEDQLELGLNHIGSGVFDVRAGEFPDLRQGQSCRLYVGRSDKFTVLLFQGLVTEVESPRAGVVRITVRQRSAALEQPHSIALSDCTALHVLQEIVDATGIPFATAKPDEPEHAYLTTPVPRYTSHGPMKDALNNLGGVFGVPDAVWYEQPDGRVFWGSWSRTAMAQTPLPLQGNAIRERDAAGHAVYIPMVASLRPGMLIQAPDMAFRIEKLQLKGDTMRLEWLPAPV